MVSEILMPQSVKVPTLDGLETLTVTLCCPPPEARLPEAGETEHQVPGLPGTGPATQLRVAVPVFLMVMAWPAGVAPPEIPVKLKVVGERKMVGRVGAAIVTVPMVVGPLAQMLLPVGGG